jgi:transposase
MGATRKQYTQEFKQEAVRLITEGGVPLAQASRDLDINPNMLRRWRTELAQHGHQAFPRHGTPVQQDLARPAAGSRNSAPRT